MIAFRTDASIEIGTGHVMRCLTLATALGERGADCVFLCRRHEGHLLDFIAGRGHKALALPALDTTIGDTEAGNPPHAAWLGTGWATDARDSLAALADHTGGAAVDWLVVDHYALDARWEKALRPACTRLMVIDDLADRSHDCDLLLDQNLGHAVADYDGLVPDRCTRLIGPKYALLRSEFAEARAQALADRAGRGLRHLLITMGGVDQADATSTVLTALRDAPLPEGLRITVIMGSNAPALDRVRALAQDMPRPTEVAVDVPDMAAAMAAADLAISAGGGTTWERCCLGLPSIIVETADNQAGIAQAMAAAGAALDPGPVLAPDFAQTLQAALAESSDAARLDALSANAAAICDGEGAWRVTTQLVGRFPNTDTEYYVRLADMDDAKDVWCWRNAGCASKYYRSQATTPLDAHMEWFENALKNPDRLLLIVEKESMRLGHVRIDRKNGKRDEAEISVYVNPDYRGKGYGRNIIESAMVFAQKFGVSLFTAEVHENNSASRSVFQKAGFYPVSFNDHFCGMMVDKAREG